MLEQNHDYNKLLKEFEKHDVIVTNFYLSNKKVSVNDEIKIPRKRFTEERKQEIREHYLLTDNFAKTAKSFCLNESTVRKIVKSTLGNDVKPSDKGNRSGAGRPLTYPKEAENELVAWVLQLLDAHMPVSVLALQEKAKKLIRPHSPSFGASRGLVEKVFARHRLSLRNRTSVSQKLPRQLEGVLTKFYKDAGRFMRIGKNPRSSVGNVHETPAFFNMVPSKSICKTGSKECIVRTSDCEKKHVTNVLSATADGKMLPPMIILKGKTTKTIEKLRLPDGFIVKTQAKAWMDEELMHVWLEDIWLKHTKLMSQKLGFENSLLTFDAFSAHKTDEVEAKLVQSKSDILMIPAGCTSKCQPMDVCINKPFKANLRKCWVGYVAKMIDEKHDQIPPPSRQHMVDWVEEAYNAVSSDIGMVKRSFDVCGITSTDKNKVRNSSFYKSCMENASKHLEDEDDIDEDDPFIL